MKNLTARSGFLLMSLLLCRLLSSADDAQKLQQTASLFSKAAVGDLRSQNSTPFHLRLEIHTVHLGSKPFDGTYDEVWGSPTIWRRQISFPEFAQQEVGDSDGRWLARNLDFRPQAVYLLSRVVETSMPVPLQPDELVKKVSDRKKDGTGHCVEVKRGTLERTLCFDSQGPLASWEDHNPFDDRRLRLEYTDFQKFGEKLYPREMRVYEHGEQVLDIKVVELSQLPDAAPTHFDHVPSARLMAACESWEPGIPATKVPPRYPSEARRDRQQGTVILYAALAADGSVEKLTLLQTAGNALDAAAIAAVKQWIYAPAMCGTKPQPTEIEVHVNFTLSSG
jgi:TonB family protein